MVQLISVFPRVLAYIDPGTGSIILQALAAVVASALIAIRVFWHRIVGFFRPKKPAGNQANDPNI